MKVYITKLTHNSTKKTHIIVNQSKQNILI